MWTRPDIKYNKFIDLRNELNKIRLNLKAAKSIDERDLIGADYCVNCCFSKAVLFASNDLEEIADYFRIEVSHG